MPIAGTTVLSDPSSGNGAAVDDSGRLSVLARSDWQVAMEKGDTFAWTNVSANIVAAATILLVANDSPTRNLHITKIMVSSDVGGPQFAVHLPATATWAGTAIVGVPLNRILIKTAPATAKSDESANSKANVIALIHGAADVPVAILGDGTRDICILGEDDAIAVDAITEPGESQCIILGYFKDAA